MFNKKGETMKRKMLAIFTFMIGSVAYLGLVAAGGHGGGGGGGRGGSMGDRGSHMSGGHAGAQASHVGHVGTARTGGTGLVTHTGVKSSGASAHGRGPGVADARGGYRSGYGRHGGGHGRYWRYRDNWYPGNFYLLAGWDGLYPSWWDRRVCIDPSSGYRIDFSFCFDYPDAYFWWYR